MIQRPNVGVIGLGVMGLPMARNLLEAGYPLSVHTRTPGRANELVEAGAHWCPSPRAVAADSDVVLTMLPDSPDVLAVADGPEGLLAGARSGLTWIELSSIDPAVTLRLTQRAQQDGVWCLDAPVSGGEQAAIAGSLSIMVGGEREVFEKWYSLLGILGTSVIYVGGTGSGQVAKLCNQVVVGGTIAAVAEALVLAGRHGVDPSLVREAMLGGFARSRVLEVHGQRMLEQNFAPGFRTSLHLKDLTNALRAGEASDSALPVSSVVAGLMESQLSDGIGELDHSALFTVIDSLSGRAAAHRG
jgi:2-hydroxy-3-oxopropionate reductase